MLKCDRIAIEKVQRYFTKQFPETRPAVTPTRKCILLSPNSLWFCRL